MIVKHERIAQEFSLSFAMDFASKLLQIASYSHMAIIKPEEGANVSFYFSNEFGYCKLHLYTNDRGKVESVVWETGSGHMVKFVPREGCPTEADMEILNPCNPGQGSNEDGSCHFQSKLEGTGIASMVPEGTDIMVCASTGSVVGIGELFPVPDSEEKE